MLDCCWCCAGSGYSSSRYSAGTSSSGTSRVRTSFPSRARESSTPDMTPASNAFPSCSNSSTLSESTLSTLDNPCRSPDCSPEDWGTAGEPGRRSTFRRLLIILSAFPLAALAPAFFFAAGFFRTALRLANFPGVLRFRPGCFAGDFLRLLFDDLVDFFLAFFLGAIRTV